MNEGFKKRKKEIDRESANEFAGKADVSSERGIKKKSGPKRKVEAYSTKLYPETIKAIKAYAYVKRLDSQRKVIEKAIDCLYSSEEKEEYLKMYREKED